MMLNRHGHESVAGNGDTSASGMWDSGDKASDMEAFELAADVACKTAFVGSIGGDIRIKSGANMGILETV